MSCELESVQTRPSIASIAEGPRYLAQQRKANELTLRDRFDPARKDGDLAPDFDIAGLASYAMAVFDGIAVRAASGAAPATLRQTAEHALAILKLQSTSGIGAGPPKRGRPQEFRPTDALEAAMRIFCAKRYDGASIADLTEAMGFARPSLYRCFESKEALLLPALDRYASLHLAYVGKAVKAPTSRAVVERMLAGAIAAQLTEHQPRGCFMLINGMQSGDPACAMRIEVQCRIERAHAVLVDRFNRARREDDLPGDLEPEGLARLLTSVMHGISSLGAAGADGDQIRALADSMLNLWPDAGTVRHETRLRLLAEFSTDQYHGRPERQFLAFERPVRKASASRNPFSNRRAGRAPCPGKAKEDCHDQAHADQLTGLPLCAAGRYRAQGEGCGV